MPDAPAGAPEREPGESLPRQRLDLVLHVGMGKTGTTSLQAMLRRNRALLAEHGVLYPVTPGPERHPRFGLYVAPDDEFADSRVVQQQRRDEAWRASLEESPSAFRELFRRRLLEEIDEAGVPRVLMSDEALFRSSDGALARVREFADRYARSVRVVCYLRRQDDHFVSRYQQAVKLGEVRRIADRRPRPEDAARYDYLAWLDAWDRVVGPDRLVVRRFSRDAFVGDSLYADFADACALPVPLEDLEPVGRRNESLDAESVEFLRILNLVRARRRGADPRHLDNRRVVRRLAAASDGPTLTLPEADLDSFMEQCREGNREVARRWLGTDGDLFGPRRRTEGTTTRQYLDPDRLDHYLAVAGLPERLHAPMRRLVEQEAR